jgi:hypothetical protein
VTGGALFHNKSAYLFWRLKKGMNAEDKTAFNLLK